jgi:hypothetical protein
MTSILFGGTALGWYRECTIIPYTTDVDFAALAAEYNPKLEETIKWNGRLSLLTVFGMVHHSLSVHAHTCCTAERLTRIRRERAQCQDGLILPVRRRRQ